MGTEITRQNQQGQTSPQSEALTGIDLAAQDLPNRPDHLQNRIKTGHHFGRSLVTQTSNSFEVTLSPAGQVNLNQILMQVPGGVGPLFFRRHCSANLDVQLTPAKLVILKERGEIAEYADTLTKHGLIAAGADSAVLAVGALLVLKRHYGIEPLSDAESGLYQVLKKDFICCGPKRTGVHINHLRMFLANDHYYKGTSAPHIAGLLPESGSLNFQI